VYVLRVEGGKVESLGRLGVAVAVAGAGAIAEDMVCSLVVWLFLIIIG
jgi:hypothetical protein